MAALATPNAKSITTHFVADGQATLVWLTPVNVEYSACVFGPNTSRTPEPAATQTVAEGHSTADNGVDTVNDVQVLPASVVRITPVPVERMQNDEVAQRSAPGEPVNCTAVFVQLVPPSAVVKNRKPVEEDPTATQCCASVHDTVKIRTPTGVLTTDQVVPRSEVRFSPALLVPKHVVADTQSTSYSQSPSKTSPTCRLVHDAPPSVVRCGGHEAVMHVVGEPQLTPTRFDTVRGVDNTSEAVTTSRAETASLPRSVNATDAAKHTTETTTA